MAITPEDPNKLKFPVNGNGINGHSLDLSNTKIIVSSKIEIADAPISDGKALARKLVDPPSKAFMGIIDTMSGGRVSPDMLTRTGFYLHALGTLWQEQAHIADHAITPSDLKFIFGLKGLGLYFDKGDGNMADIFDERYPGRHNRAKGQVLDATLDRKQEAVAALLRARTAYLKGNGFGEFAAYSVAFTCTLPSIERARIETLGFKPPETGKNQIESLGTKSRRAILTELAGIRTIAGFNIQPGVDLIGAATNLNTARVRRNIYNKYKGSVPEPKDEEDRIKRETTIAYANDRLVEIEEVQKEIARATFATFIAMRVLPYEVVRAEPLDKLFGLVKQEA